MINLLENDATFGENANGLFIARSQDITTDFLDELASERLASAHMRAREMHKVASIPTSVAELWARMGMRIEDMTTREIVSQLRKDGLEAFIATSKAV